MLERQETYITSPSAHCIQEPIVVTVVGTKRITCGLGFVEPRELKRGILGPKMSYTTSLGSAGPSLMQKYKFVPLFKHLQKTTYHPSFR